MQARIPFAFLLIASACFFSIAAGAKTPTTELITKCQDRSTRESVLRELEKESGLNFNLESLAGDEALTSLVDDLQNRRMTETAEASAKSIRRILGIARAGVTNATTESLNAGLNKKTVETESAMFLTMMEIFAPVLDLTERAVKNPARSVSEADVAKFMTEVDSKMARYAQAEKAMSEIQSDTQANGDLDKHTLNIQKQTCLAAIQEIRK